MLLELMQAGLSYREARSISLEEALCLLHHARLVQEIRALEAEQVRIASLAFSDAQEQSKLLVALHHRGQALQSVFYRPVPDLRD